MLIALTLLLRKAKLVSYDSGSSFVASLASLLAASFPGISVWPGTQCIETEAPLSIASFVAWLVRIWQAWPREYEAVISLYKAAWLSEKIWHCWPGQVVWLAYSTA